MPEILFGNESRKLAGQYIKNLGVKKILVVTDAGVIRAGWLRDVIQSLEQYDIQYTIFSNVSPNPRDFEVMNGAEVYHQKQCNAIVALGGGSPMDCAKGIGMVVADNKGILNFVGVDRISNPLPPLICIPTTAGTSADVSQFAIVLDSHEKVKVSILSKAIVPDISLIDPETTITADKYLTATTGIDTLVHAVEAFVSRGSSGMTDIHALEAIRLTVQYLQRRVDNPEDSEATEKMMLASLEAGLAFSNAILGAVHAMAHSLGGFLDLPHGECNAILLPHVVDYNYDAVPERFDVIGRLFGLNYTNEPSEQRKSMLINRLIEYKNSLGVRRTLAGVGVKSSDLPILARKAHVDPCLITNPKNADLPDLEAIYEEAM